MFEESNTSAEYCFSDDTKEKEDIRVMEQQDSFMLEADGSFYSVNSDLNIEEDFSQEFEDYKNSFDELEDGKVYGGKVLNFTKAYTGKLRKPILTLMVRVSDGVVTPKDIMVDFVFDKENKKYLDTTFNRLQKALKTLGYELDKMKNIDFLVEELKTLIGETIYIKPYDYKGFQKYNIVKKPM